MVLIPQLAAFYKRWNDEMHCENVIMSISKEGVIMKPLDIFCPICDTADTEFEFEGQHQTLSWHMNRLMVHALGTGRSLDDAVLDVFYTYNMRISPSLHSVVPSLGSVNGACLVDQPRMTLNVLIDHYTIHTPRDIPLLLRPMAVESMNYLAMRKINGAHTGTASTQEISAALKLLTQQTQGQSNSALIQTQSN